MNVLRHITYNLLDYGRSSDPDRLALVRETIKCTGGDVFSIQEIHAYTPAERLEVFIELAETLGLEYRATDKHGVLRSVFDPGQGNRGVGVMWRPGVIEAVPGSLRTYERTLTNGMAMVRLLIDSRIEMTAASSHLPPRWPNVRADECIYIASEVRDAGQHGIVGCDWNNVFGSLTQDDLSYEDDPYASHPWQPRYAGKASPDRETGNGVARLLPMLEVAAAGLYDPAAFIGAAPYHTVGHWGENAINKRIDGPWVTHSVVKQTCSITSFEDVPAREASDHLPVMLEVYMEYLDEEWPGRHHLATGP